MSLLDEVLEEEEERAPRRSLVDDVLEEEAAAVARPGQVEAIGRGVAQGLSLGFADEIAAGTLASEEVFDETDALVRDAMRRREGEGFTAYLRRLVSPPEAPERTRFTPRYEALRDEARRKDAEASAAHPWAYGGGQVAGSLIPAILTGGQATVGGRIAAGAGQGAVTGVGASSADTLEGLAEDAAKGAAVGYFLTGGAESLGAGARALARGFTRRGAELADDAARAAEKEALEGVEEAQKRARLSPEARAAQEAEEAVKAAERVMRETKAAPRADPVLQQADDAARRLRIARGELDATPEAQAVQQAKERLDDARKGLQALRAKWGSSDEVRALQEADEAVKAGKASLDEAKRAWEANPKRRHTVEAQREHARLVRQHDALMAIRRNDAAVQRATREAWSARSGWDDTKLQQLLPEEARAVLKALDREALQTIRAHGLTPAINRAKGAMKQAEKKVATSTTAAAADEKAALEAINRAERVWRTAQAHLDKMRSASSAKVYEAERRAAERALKQAEAVLRQSEQRLAQSPLAAQVRQAEARAKRAALEAERAKMTHTQRAREAESGVRTAKTQADLARERAAPVLRAVTEAEEQAIEAGRRTLATGDALKQIPETTTSKLFRQAAHHRGAATGLGAGSLGAAMLTGNPVAIGAGAVATVLPWAVSNPAAVKALEVVARGSSPAATYAAMVLRDPTVRGVLELFPSSDDPEPTPGEIAEAEEIIRRALAEDEASAR